METAIFAEGCFWGVEANFRKIKGVVDTQVGYTGGKTKNPTYQQVCSGITGHAEAIRIEFNPEEVSYGELLNIFWETHNPTTLNRQGPDIGTQYRSAIYYTTEQQKELAIRSKESLGKSGKYSDPIVTEIVPAEEFYRAEEYHQRYIEKNGKGYCHF